MPTRREVLKRAGLATAGVIAGGAAINAAAPRLLPESPAIDPNVSFWSDVLPEPGPPLSHSIDADVAIVGGGLTGLSAAYHLRGLLPGHRVVLLEARRCGNGASARNGGMLLTSTADRWLNAGADPELDRRIYATTVDNIAAIAQLASRHSIDIELDLRGAAQVLLADSETAPARETAARLAARGQQIEYWTAEQVRAHIGTGAYPGALFDRASGQVHPGKLVTLFETAARQAGAEIYESTAVASLIEGSVHRLTTVAGPTLRAPVVVLATNAYSSKLGYLRQAYAPIISHMGITAPL